jgi:ATP-dependent HslUV protease ATP-binding subunit HslU
METQGVQEKVAQIVSVAKKKKFALEDLTPKEIVKQLDTYIIGQEKAKKKVAIALRNRTRRQKLPEEIREEIAPKNIMMIGPTGVGKTEIARRLAKLCGAPFLKVEATKYTEVGYVGRDVESMIRDLMAVGFSLVKSEMQDELRDSVKDVVTEDLLDLLLPGSRDKKKGGALPLTIFGTSAKEAEKTTSSTSDASEKIIAPSTEKTAETEDSSATLSTRQKFAQMLKEGKLEGREVEIVVSKTNRAPSMEIIAGGSMEDMESAMQNITSMLNGGNKSKKKNVTIAEARTILTEEHLDRMIDPDKVSDIAKERVEQMGIIFIDEIDKIAVSSGHGADISREGVQRDILPIVEGSQVNTKYGVIDTTHILFIGAGAFNMSKPSDLVPELQGRFPLRVELDSLNADDFRRILTEPKNSLTRQYEALLATEGVTIKFSPESIVTMSKLAADVNNSVENIGARRLHTIMETLLEDLSFDAEEHAGETIEITPDYVNDRLKDISANQDLSKYIL